MIPEKQDSLDISVKTLIKICLTIHTVLDRSKCHIYAILITGSASWPRHSFSFDLTQF